MSIVNIFRKLIRNNHSLRSFVAYNLASSGIFDKYILRQSINELWQKRIDDVKSCPDNINIPRVENAGKVVRGKQIMHNGLRIQLGSYYGPEVARQLLVNEGVHEPQEEYAFQEVLKGMVDGATMIELGSFWAFYSMWFNSKVKNARNFMVEPDKFNLGFGKLNFKLNNLQGDFTNAFVSSKSDENTSPETICIEDFVIKNNIEFIDILHSDIQGYELEMLKGADKLLNLHKIGYLFISTHSNEIHFKCVEMLKNKNYIILTNINLNETFAIDGLIVAKSKSYQGVTDILVSKRKQ